MNPDNIPECHNCGEVPDCNDCDYCKECCMCDAATCEECENQDCVCDLIEEQEAQRTHYSAEQARIAKKWEVLDAWIKGTTPTPKVIHVDFKTRKVIKIEKA